ncbi:MAG: TldD/PmbA family protein [Bacteroidota bacterium]|nr:TldD/PmbA family protein [Bacteroidota bacterium]MDP4232172.1 TldD/PmbA family protein [Bacteroidota bacterium]MDP4241120.1 TldD/PmbA family protein [Bacteroidota bacterium]MDP4286512.1 TldD/PmbA family protein [Bacteroidota bacterium]
MINLLDLDELQALGKKILAHSKSEWAEVSLGSSHVSNLRYAANTVTTSGSYTNTSVSITAVNGKRAGTVSTNDLSDDGLHRAVARAEEIAGLAPENDELAPPLTAKQAYPRSSAYDARSTDLEWAAQQRSKIAASAIKEATAHQFQTAGFLESGIHHSVYRNTKGIIAADQHTRTTFSNTMRSAEGKSSGWNKRASHAISLLDAQSAILRSSEKCVAWDGAKSMDPGVYKAILEPSAVADLLQQFAWALDARDAEEGRSAFSRPNGATALGTQIVGEKVHIYSDPSHPLVPSGVYGESGLAVPATEWVAGGKLMNLHRNRYWAQKSGKAPLPGPTNLIMDGGTMLPEDYLTTVKEGLLITSFWYIRDLDNQTLVKTGLTRDGLYWVEDGKIQYGVSNFRWNESPITMLQNVIDFSVPVVTAPRDGWDGMPMYVPMIYVSGFNFASQSDAV